MRTKATTFTEKSTSGFVERFFDFQQMALARKPKWNLEFHLRLLPFLDSSWPRAAPFINTWNLSLV